MCVSSIPFQVHITDTLYWIALSHSLPIWILRTALLNNTGNNIKIWPHDIPLKLLSHSLSLYRNPGNEYVPSVNTLLPPSKIRDVLRLAEGWAIGGRCCRTRVMSQRSNCDLSGRFSCDSRTCILTRGYNSFIALLWRPWEDLSNLQITDI